MTKDYTFKNPSWPGLFEEEGEDLQNQYVTYEYFDYPGRFKKDGAGQRFTRFLIDSLRNNTHGSEGRSNSFALQPGKLFTLANHPQESFNTQWQLVSIVHSGVQPGALESGGGGGTSLSNHFVFIPASQNWRPRPMPKPVVPGPQTAVVVGPATEEIWTDKYGRCSLQFQWDREGQWNDWSSCWIRVSQGWAGAGWGMVALPRIGQEVIVDFLNGDPDQPVVTGRLYNDDNMPSLDLPLKKTQMTLRSKTHRGDGFNELRFEDYAGQEELFLHAQRDMNVVVKNNQTLLVEKGSLAESIKQTRNTRADTVRIEAETKIELIVGSGSIIMTKDNINLTFESSNIKLDVSNIDQNALTINLNKGGGNTTPTNENTNLRALVENSISTVSTGGDDQTAATAENVNQDANQPPSVTATAGRADGRDTVVTLSDGTTERRSGGTLAWRNNNPGNIRAGDFATRNGAIGTGPNGFAIFPDEQTGNDAIGTLLQSRNYRDLSINDAVARYAPPVENDTATYQRQLQRLTGLDGNRTINNLNTNELDSVVNAIRHHEGWREGTIVTEE